MFDCTRPRQNPWEKAPIYCLSSYNKERVHLNLKILKKTNANHIADYINLGKRDTHHAVNIIICLIRIHCSHIFTDTHKDGSSVHHRHVSAPAQSVTRAHHNNHPIHRVFFVLRSHQHIQPIQHIPIDAHFRLPHRCFGHSLEHDHHQSAAAHHPKRPLPLQLLVNGGPHPGAIVRGHSAAGPGWQRLGHSDARPQSPHANHYECVSVESGHFGHAAGRTVHADHTGRCAVAKFRFWRGNVQDFAIFAR